MRSTGSLPRRRHLAGVSLVAAVAGGAAAAAGGADAVPIALAAALAGALVSFAVGVALVLHDIRDQQRRIIDQLETQARLLHRAARLAGGLTEDRPGAD